MDMLILLSLPFGVVGYLRPSWWVVGLPYVVWGGLAGLESLGLLPGTSSVGPPEAVLLAGTVGALIAAVGVLLGRARRLRAASRGL